MPSLASHLIPLLIRATRRQRLFAEPQRARDFLDEAAVRPASYAPPRLRDDVRLTRADRNGWPVYVLEPAEAPASGTVVYVHGGGWAKEIVAPHWRLCAQMAAEAHTRVLVPVYPLAGPVTASNRGTAASVVSGVADLVRDELAEHDPVCLAGDSAGGQIALSAVMELRDRGVPPLPATILISPALDLAMDNPDIDRVQPRDPWLAREGLRVFIDAWRVDLPLDDPRVSPLCGDFTGVGPLTVFAATRDIVLPDVRLGVERARAAGVDVTYVEEKDLLHVHPLQPTPEGRAARETIVGIVRSAVG
ncbi:MULTISPECIES: alpha/beta fold hydrolase [unclassified Dietzia]|uniref:alpha/beta fold hydrolase n=1 Tax=unclassified Dietzia TaxID=2617939 RepID=UPI0015FBB4E9|nr:alpha/beta fold hydrolase [Dietzia sp. DQ12-76]MBB1025171.1 alpha/beta hydrolase [Dietzia sp. DQ12-76]MBB1028022.1 alpha/beta hydrolase [Dietzia sp. DQ11-38-2]